MATKGDRNLTLLDWASGVDDAGVTMKVVEILDESNEMMDDMVWVEGNLPTGTRTTVRSGLPEAYWKQYNKGVPRSKGVKKQMDEACGMLRVYSVVDKDLAELNGEGGAFLASEEAGFIEGMTQQVQTAFIYGNIATDPERIMGLTPRYSDATAENAENILNGGGSASTNTSIWLVCWGDDTVHAMFPVSKPTGLQRTPKGVQTVSDDDGDEMEAYRTLYGWDCGLVVRDWRFIVRICNVDVATLTGTGATGAKLIEMMVVASELPPYLKGKCAFYMNRKIKTFLRRQITNKANVNLTFENVAGKKVMAFDGIPCRRVDKIVNTESTVTGLPTFV